MNSSHLIRVLSLKLVFLFLTLAVLTPGSSAGPLRLAINGGNNNGGNGNGQHQHGSNNNSNRISIRGGGLSLNAGGQKRFRISRGNKRENNGFYTTRFGKRSVPSTNYYNALWQEAEPIISSAVEKRNSNNKNANHLKTDLNQEVAAYAVEGNDFNGNEDNSDEWRREEPQLREEDVVRTTPLGRPPSVQPRNIQGFDEFGRRVACVYAGMRNFYICDTTDGGQDEEDILLTAAADIADVAELAADVAEFAADAAFYDQ